MNWNRLPNIPNHCNLQTYVIIIKLKSFRTVSIPNVPMLKCSVSYSCAIAKLNTYKIFVTEHEGKKGWGSIDEGIILKVVLHK